MRRRGRNARGAIGPLSTRQRRGVWDLDKPRQLRQDIRRRCLALPPAQSVSALEDGPAQLRLAHR
eukprot:13837959-Alexandrium_andersonii.AAC.1